MGSEADWSASQYKISKSLGFQHLLPVRLVSTWQVVATDLWHWWTRWTKWCLRITHAIITKYKRPADNISHLQLWPTNAFEMAVDPESLLPPRT